MSFGLLCLMMAFMPLATKAQQCSGTTTLTTESGTFSDGSGTNNYTNGLDCSWLIQLGSRRTITLNFLDFNTGFFDLVRVYDGRDSSAPQLGEFSGTNLPNELTSSSNSLYVTFTSDEYGVRAGWTASYTSSESPLILSTSTLSAAASASTATFQIFSNTSWSITDDADWISTSSSSGMNDETITVTIAEHTSNFSDRTGTITVTDGNTIRTVTVTQNPIYIWTEATAAAGWSARYNHTTVVYKDKLWVMGGRGDVFSSSSKNDVWSSEDGRTWVQETAAAGWSVRLAHTTVVYKDKLWVMGGRGDVVSSSSKNDVWSSEDGITWVQETANAGWSARFNHTTVVYEDKLWVIGGGGGGSSKNDVWSSEDGRTWVQETANAGWSVRNYYTTVVHQDKLWVMGGYYSSSKNDVWSSEDGITWVQETATAGWSARLAHTTVVYKDKLWVMGGDDGSYKNDVWSSEDGRTWVQETAAAGWSGRSDHTTVVYEDKLWVMGGRGAGFTLKNDVWHYGGPNAPSLALSTSTLSVAASASEEITGITVYPNPTQGVIRIRNTVEEMSYTLSDSKGNLLKKGTLTPDKDAHSIDISSLAKGMYFLKAQTSKGSITKRVVKQ